MDFSAFEATPGISVIVRPDDPNYTLVAVSNDFIKATGLRREAVIGIGHFELFTKNFGSAGFAVGTDIRESFRRILQDKCPNEIPVQRFDIQKEDSTFDLKYWKINNAPILSESGEVLYIIHSATDITEQVRSAQKTTPVKGIENIYNIFMTAPVIIGILKGDDYVIELANDGLLEVWGRSADVIGKPLIEALPELATQGFIPLLDKVRTTGVPFYAYTFPIRLTRQGKEEVLYFDFVYKPVYENGMTGKADGVISVGHDITEQVRARQRVKNVVEQATDPVLILMGEELVLEIANQPLFELWQVGAEALHKPFLEILPEMKDQMFLGLLKNVLHTGEPFFGFEQPAVFKRKNGVVETRYVNFSYQPYREADDTISGVLVLATDVTEQVSAKQKLIDSERNLRNIILRAPVAMCILMSADHVVDIANGAMIELWGKPVAAVMNKPIFEGLPDAKTQGLEELLANVYHTGVAFHGNERPVELLRNGRAEVVYQNFVYEPYKDAAQNTQGILVIAIDVTQQVLARRKIEEIVIRRTQELALANTSLLKSNEELKRSNASLEEFAHAASHDMKEPIRKVITFANHLKDMLKDRMSGTEKHYFERMGNAAQRMGQLVDDMLEYSHVSERPHEIVPVDLNEKIRRVLFDLELLIEDKGAYFNIGDLPLVKGHRRQLQQLFQNLISNALKYSKPNVAPQITITASIVIGHAVPVTVLPEQQEQPFHLIEVKDNGIGFEQQYADRIFAMFQRLHGKSEYSGTGIGLSIARKVAANHHGYIWAEAKPGDGAVFKVLLPA